MIDPLLQSRLRPVVNRLRWTAMVQGMALGWMGGAVLGLLARGIQELLGMASVITFPAVALLGLVAAIGMGYRRWSRPVDPRRVAQSIERQFPALQGLLLTAVQQQPTPGQGWNYFQQQLLQSALQHSRENPWTHCVPTQRLAMAHGAALAAFALFGIVVYGLRLPSDRPKGSWNAVVRLGVEVTPGDVQLEKGENLVVLARFGGKVPAKAELVIQQSGKPERRVPLARNLADPIFGGSVSSVAEDFTYRVEYAGNQTKDFKVGVFEHPKLERSDADLVYPSFTGDAPRHVDETQRISAVEGTRLELKLQFNKRVQSATLVPRGTNASPLELIVSTNSASASLAGLVLEKSGTFDLRLVDADGRTNKLVPQFVFDVSKNRSPELRLASPVGDAHPSPIEELHFEGTVWDDFGISAYGLAVSVKNGEPKWIELGKDVPAREKRTFKHVLRLEEFGLSPDDLVAWFVWADDLGSDSQTRRNQGDLFFGEVRPFEQTFREGEGGGGGGGEGQGQGGQTTKLAELQKQIMSATWRLQRDHGNGKRPTETKKPASEGKPSGSVRPPASSAPTAEVVDRSAEVSTQVIEWARSVGTAPNFGHAVFGQAVPPDREERRQRSTAAKSTPGKEAAALKRLENKESKPGNYEEDLEVVREAAAQAIEQAKETMQRQQDPRSTAQWSSVVTQLEEAQKQLDAAAKNPSALSKALEAQEAAYASLLKLRERETQVTRNRNQNSQGGGAGEQMSQRQIDQLDLTQSENRYETEKQARSPKDAAEREKVQIMNRLEELARRQQDVNQKLKELQTALQEARNEKEREEIRRELKRLQEEQKQMLADADELQQRMNRPENQSQMSEQRKQLQEARDQLQKASESTGDGQVSQALASGTRAQRQLQDMREDLRKQTSNQLKEDLRQVRSEARDLSRQQEELSKELGRIEAGGEKKLSDEDRRKELLSKLAQQEAKLTNLVQRASQLSERAEGSEPLVSRQLYDSLRKFNQDDVGNVKQFREELLRRRMLSKGLNEKLQDLSRQEGARSLELTSEMVRQGFDSAAVAAEQRARAGIDELRQGVERATESVLGDDTEALRLARDELDQLTEQLKQEMLRNRNTNTAAGGAQAGATSPGGQRNADPNQPGAQGQTPGESQDPNAPPQGSQPGQSPGTQTAQAGQRGQQGQQAQPGEQGQEGRQPGQTARQGEEGQQGQPGEQGQRGQGRQQGQQPGQEGQQAQQGQQGQQAGAGRGRGQPGQRSPNPQAQQPREQQPGQNPADAQNPLDQLLGGQRGNGGRPGGQPGTGPITGEEYAAWSDRMRDVEEMVDQPSLRNGLANAREQARQLRLEFKREEKKPDWAVVDLKIVKPLVEVRNMITEELARRGSREALVPIDRDPVPTRYSELVRRYYEQLGKDPAPVERK